MQRQQLMTKEHCKPRYQYALIPQLQQDISLFLEKIKKEKEWSGTYVDFLREIPSVGGVMIISWIELNIFCKELASIYGLEYRCGGRKQNMVFKL